MSQNLKDTLEYYDETLETLKKLESEYEKDCQENDYAKLKLDNITLQIKAIETAREDCENHIAKLEELEKNMEAF